MCLQIKIITKKKTDPNTAVATPKSEVDQANIAGKEWGKKGQ